MVLPYPSYSQVRSRKRFLRIAISGQYKDFYDQMKFVWCPNPAYGTKRQWEKTCGRWRALMRMFEMKTAKEVLDLINKSHLEFIRVDDLRMLDDDEEDFCMFLLPLTGKYVDK